MADRIAQEKKRLFKEKEQEMGRLEKRLQLKIKRELIATAAWRIE